MNQAVLSHRPHQPLRGWFRGVDGILLVAVVVLAAYGVVILYSATKVPDVRSGASPLYYMERQAIYDVMGLGALAFTATVGYRRFVHFGRLIYWGMLLSLVGVMVVGHSAYGSKRWFSLGPFHLQPSAFASLALIVALADALDRREGERMSVRELAKLLAMSVVPILLVVKQPDLGSGIIMLVTVAAVLVAAGLPGRYLLVLTVLGLGAVAAAVSLHLLHAYQLARLTSFLHQNSAATFQKSTYNIQQSKFAIGSGGLFGTGLFGGAITNGGYLPSYSTDFIFSTASEQLGFAGAAFLLLLYSVIAWRIWRTAAAAEGAARLCTVGILALIGFSVFENAGMAMGIMPIAGIPLPLVSFGGSAVIDVFAAVGLVLSVPLDPAA